MNCSLRLEAARYRPPGLASCQAVTDPTAHMTPGSAKIAATAPADRGPWPPTLPVRTRKSHRSLLFPLLCRAAAIIQRP